jgi:hypothetical protein
LIGFLYPIAKVFIFFAKKQDANKKSGLLFTYPNNKTLKINKIKQTPLYKKVDNV